MRAAPALLLVGVLAAACGGNAPLPQPPVAHGPPLVAKAPEPPPLVLEYIVLRRRWVEKLISTTPAELKAWSEAPENAPLVEGSFRHILLRVGEDATDAAVAAQRKKAQAILDRIKKGEDFGKLAKQASEDPGSKDNGGELPAEKVQGLVDPVRNAFAALKPGETTPDLVRSQLGFHIIRKDRASDEQIERAYRKAKAPEVTKKLGENLLARLQGNAPSRAAIAEAVEAVLGERAVSDVDRPHASIVDREHLEQVHVTEAAKAALKTFAHSAHPGDLLPSPAVDGDTVLVARAIPPGPR